MKKIKKLSMAGLLLIPMLSLASCSLRGITSGPSNSTNPPHTGNTGNTGNTGTGTTQPVPKETIVTIHESSDVTFADGSKTKTLESGTKLKIEDFATNTLGGHTIGGIAVYGTGNEVVSFEDISTYTPEGEVTVVPYWTPENGDMYLYGSDGFDLYHDEEGIRWLSAPKTANTLVDGYPGALITSDNSLKAGSSFRAKVAYDVKSTEGYDLFYRYQNYGEAAISFTVYQMIEGNDYSDETTYYSSSESITLEPGEASDVITLSIDQAQAANDFFTVVKFDSDVEGFSFGAAMELKTKPVVQTPVKVSLDLPDGVTVDGFDTEQMKGSNLVLPTAEQVKVTSGMAVLGWYNPATGEEITSEHVLTEDITIAPYFNVGSDTATQLSFGTTGDNSNIVVDTNTNIEKPTVKTNVFDGYVKGTDVTGTAYTETSSFRVKCNYNWGNHTVTNCKVYYTVTNNGTEAISLSMNLCASGTTITATGKIENLAVGETRTIAIDFNQTNKTASNLLTIVKLASQGSALNIHVGVAVEA